MTAAPQRYRLWCGNRRYTDWLDDLEEVWRIALREGLAYQHPVDGSAGLGPLTRIEYSDRPQTP